MQQQSEIFEAILRSESANAEGRRLLFACFGFSLGNNEMSRGECV